MKSIYTLAISLLVLSHVACGQVGVDNTSPDASSVIDLTSTDKGILIPRMTSTQRLAIATPATSLLVFDTTEGKFYFYNGTQWSALNAFDQNSGSTTATHNGNVVINGTLTATSYGGINVSGTVPAGGIIMWSGSTANIPTGWALCDGSNGTPNLRDRFIVGAGSSYATGTTGGTNSVTLGSEHMPSHTHTLSGPGEHQHTLKDRFSFDSSTAQNWPPNTAAEAVGTGSTYFGMAGDNGNSQYRYFNTSTASGEGDHTHTVNASGNASPASLENRPPYYALAFIMKL